MSKSLFKDDLTYTEAAETLSTRVHNALEPLFDRLIEAGYSPREILSIVVESAHNLSTSKILPKKFETDKTTFIEFEDWPPGS